MDMQSEATATSPCISEALTGIINGKRKTSGLYGGSPDSLIRHVEHVGEQDLASYQGFDDTGDDGSLHNLIRRIIEGLEKVEGLEKDEDSVEHAWAAIWYRMEQIQTAGPPLTIHRKIPPTE
ncbi:MAG: hypothetical protein Q9171_003688 [Xanthocarpia ochracea]